MQKMKFRHWIKRVWLLLFLVSLLLLTGCVGSSSEIPDENGTRQETASSDGSAGIEDSDSSSPAAGADSLGAGAASNDSAENGLESEKNVLGETQEKLTGNSPEESSEPQETAGGDRKDSSTAETGAFKDGGPSERKANGQTSIQDQTGTKIEGKTDAQKENGVSSKDLGSGDSRAAGKTESNLSRNSSAANSSESNPEVTGLLLAKETISVRRILDQMVASYRNAKTYRDQGEICVSWTQNGKPYERRVAYRTNFQRPNRIFLEVNQTGILADGKVMCAYTSEMPGMLLQKECPAEIGFMDLLSEQEIYWSLTDVESNQFSCLPPPLLLLLSEKPLDTFLYEVEPGSISLLEPAEYEERVCYRISANRHVGPTILWIDAETNVLRRVELPKQILQKTSGDGGSETEAMELSLDFHQAELDWTGTVEMSAPANTVIVPSFTAPQLELLGKPFPDFEFSTLDGKNLRRADYQNKCFFLFFWSIYEQNVLNFKDMETLYQKFKENPEIIFCGINVDPISVSNTKIQEAAQKFGITMPIVRDKIGNVAKMLRNGDIFSCFLTDSKGRVQFCDTLTTFHPSSRYEQNIEQVLKGKDIYPLRIREIRQAEQDYRATIEQWIKNGIFLKEVRSDRITIKEKSIAPVSELISFEKTEYWNCTELRSPSWILPIPEKKRILVLENGKSAAELNLEGKIVARHVLDIPDDDFCTRILTYPSFPASISEEKQTKESEQESVRPRIFAVLGKRVYFFDKSWNRLGVFPAIGTAPVLSRLSDVHLDDLDGDGKAELYAAVQNDAQIQKISHTGEVLKIGTGISNVFQMKVVQIAGKQRLCAMDQSGDISIFNPESMELVESRSIPHRTLSNLANFDFEQEGTDLLAAISIENSGNLKVIGLRLGSDVEMWSLDLPNFAYQRKIEKILPIFTRVGSSVTADWLIIGPNSTLFFMEPSGILIDQFNFGKIITGSASCVVDGKPYVFLASPDAVSAFELSR